MICTIVQAVDMYVAPEYNIEYVCSSNKNISRTIIFDVNEIERTGNISHPNKSNDRHKIFVPRPGSELRYLSDRHSFLALSKSAKKNSIYWHRTRSRCWAKSNSVEADLGILVLVAVIVVL